MVDVDRESHGSLLGGSAKLPRRGARAKPLQAGLGCLERELALTAGGIDPDDVGEVVHAVRAGTAPNRCRGPPPIGAWISSLTVGELTLTMPCKTFGASSKAL